MDASAKDILSGSKGNVFLWRGFLVLKIFPCFSCNPVISPNYFQKHTLKCKSNLCFSYPRCRIRLTSSSFNEQCSFPFSLHGSSTGEFPNFLCCVTLKFHRIYGPTLISHGSRAKSFYSSVCVYLCWLHCMAYLLQGFHFCWMLGAHRDKIKISS